MVKSLSPRTPGTVSTALIQHIGVKGMIDIKLRQAIEIFLLGVMIFMQIALTLANQA
jgi:hypothetical protein